MILVFQDIQHESKRIVHAKEMNRRLVILVSLACHVRAPTVLIPVFESEEWKLSRITI